MQTKRLFSVVSVFIIVAMLLTACGGATTPAPAQPAQPAAKPRMRLSHKSPPLNRRMFLPPSRPMFPRLPLSLSPRSLTRSASWPVCKTRSTSPCSAARNRPPLIWVWNWSQGNQRCGLRSA